MAKKTTIAKVSEPAEPTASKPVTKPKKPRTTAAKSAASSKAKKAGLRAAPVTAPGAAAITEADVALRAYYIAEKRAKLGLPGDSTSDWVEAERQLKAEAKKK
jgi:hypothetical protein